MKDFSTVLVAVDFSDSSDNAFQMALAMAIRFSARLLVLHVINEPVDLRGFYVPHISFEKLEEEIEEGAKKMMESFCRRNLTTFENFECLIVPGLPYEQIIQQAEEKSADLIVLGTHGRTGLDHVLFGSTAEKVVRKSPVPVLTVRLEEDSA
ncbi:MAG: universal stress protein [Deltaproteobacteria bacterium]|jgi:universal stress protein A|nr:universal stress protein [Deltaproteobacteria bacterium]MCW8893591.1 universal stress protein [Deltaproteobacteria bacterium]MCW9048824.1 universal stress protein [Deltaproteobacteria bacterium]